MTLTPLTSRYRQTPLYHPPMPDTHRPSTPLDRPTDCEKPAPPPHKPPHRPYKIPHRKYLKPAVLTTFEPNHFHPLKHPDLTHFLLSSSTLETETNSRSPAVLSLNRPSKPQHRKLPRSSTHPPTTKKTLLNTSTKTDNQKTKNQKPIPGHFCSQKNPF